MEQWCDQVFYYRGRSELAAAGVILSCGVHGDELAPVHLLQSLQQALSAGALALVPPLLLVFANPEALACRRRFVTHNLNRLFRQEQTPDHPPPSASPSAETRRAQELMVQCQRFANLCGDVACHLDLHSTIKPSLIERFALLPVRSQPCRYAWPQPLARAGFGALIHQTRRANTFAQFSYDQFGADSFTLECGSHGEVTQGNQPLTELETWLRELLEYRGDFQQALQHAKAPTSSMAVTSSLQEFEVTEEIIRNSDSFRFLIEESEPNFSPHPAHTAFYQDSASPQAGSGWEAPAERYSLFLNSKVGIGQRAGLLLKRIEQS